jgi:YVTN family beta-propeller protein
MTPSNIQIQPPISLRMGWSLLRIAFLVIVFVLIGSVVGLAQTFTVVQTINVDIQPFGITPSPDGQTMWVANSGSVFANSNKVTIIDIGSLTEEPNKITVGNFPEDIAFTDDGSHAVVTNSTDDTVSVIDATSKTVSQTVSLASLGVSFPFGITFSKNDNRIFVTTQGGSANSIAVLDSRNINNVQPAGTVAASGFTGRPALRPIDNELLVPASPLETGPPELLVIDPSSGNVMHELILTGNTAFPNDIAVTPDGRFAYISLFDFSGGTGGVWVVDIKLLKTVTVINTGDPGVFGMGITPDGRFVFATNFIQNQVVAIDAATNTIAATIPVGRQPNEVAVTLDSTEAFVTNQNDTTVSVISIPHP